MNILTRPCKTLELFLEVNSTNIHPSIIWNYLSLFWISCQFITGLIYIYNNNIHTHIHIYWQFTKSELNQLTFCMSLDCGRKPAHPERTHADMGRTCKLYTESPGSSQVSNPGNSATVWNKTTKGNITSIEVWKRIYIFENDRCFFWVKHYILLLMWLLWTSSTAV